MFNANKNAPAGVINKYARSIHQMALKNLNKLAGGLRTQVTAIATVIRNLHARKPIHLEYRDGALFWDGQAHQINGPETDDEAYWVWGDIARECADEAELLAERIDG